jgi:hypothetical protein
VPEAPDRPADKQGRPLPERQELRQEVAAPAPLFSEGEGCDQQRLQRQGEQHDQRERPYQRKGEELLACRGALKGLAVAGEMGKVHREKAKEDTDERRSDAERYEPEPAEEPVEAPAAAPHPQLQACGLAYVRQWADPARDDQGGDGRREVHPGDQQRPRGVRSLATEPHGYSQRPGDAEDDDEKPPDPPKVELRSLQLIHTDHTLPVCCGP